MFFDKGRLTGSCAPGVLVGRPAVEGVLLRVLEGVGEGFLPPLVQVGGSSGVGKTVVVRRVCEDFQRRAGGLGFRFFYVNLRGVRTVLGAANRVLEAMGVGKVSANLGFEAVFDRVWGRIRVLKGEVGGRLFLVLILDEVDSVFVDKHFDASDFFYKFVRHQDFLGDPAVTISLFAVTNNLSILDERLDGRVRSSMGSERILFPRYSKSELVEMLSRRAAEGFKAGVLEEGLIEAIAEFVAEEFGDARRAIDLLRICGEMADQAGEKVVRRELVGGAVEKVERELVAEALKELPPKSRVLLYSAAYLCFKGGFVFFPDLYRAFSEALVRGGVKPPTERRVHELLGELEMLGLIETSNVSRGRYGYVKTVSVQKPPEHILDAFEPGWRAVEEKVESLERRGQELKELRRDLHRKLR